MTVTELLCSFRGIERLLIVIIAGFSIGYGWDLFKSGILSLQEAEFKMSSMSFKLVKAGPGIFFAFFGSIVLCWSLYQSLYIPENLIKSDKVVYEIHYDNIPKQKASFDKAVIDLKSKIKPNTNTKVNDKSNKKDKDFMADGTLPKHLTEPQSGRDGISYFNSIGSNNDLNKRIAGLNSLNYLRNKVEIQENLTKDDLQELSQAIKTLDLYGYQLITQKFNPNDLSEYKEQNLSKILKNDPNLTTLNDISEDQKREFIEINKSENDRIINYED